MTQFKIPSLLECEYIGRDLKEDPLPAFFYFSLSAQESLFLNPYNAPVEHLHSDRRRIFSFTLPGHEEGKDKMKAMEYWAENPSLLEEFFDRAAKSIGWLINEGIVDEKKCALGGLSRGGYAALQIAKREKRIPTLLAFAPVTSFNLPIEPEELLHLLALRFYIGNRDTRVSTDGCFTFFRSLVEKAHEMKKRSFHVELFITHSIGHQGHGTSPKTFKEGSLWLQQHL